MNNYKLILLKDGRNILVSDESYVKGDYTIDLLDKCLIEQVEVEKGDCCSFEFKIIAGIESLPLLTYSDEVKKELKDRYGWVDIEEFCKQQVYKIYQKYIPKDLLDDYINLFQLGFKANQSITNKMFSLEELINNFKPQFDTFINNGGAIGSSEEWIQFQNIVEWFPKFLQSLQQPIELNVEVEMRQTCKTCNDEYLESGCAYSGCGVNGTLLQPKITNNSIKILKII